MKDASALSKEVATWMTSLIEETLKNKERFCLLLSGGNTPKNLYTLLAAEPFRKQIDWKKLHIFFGDERVVPFSDDRNNGKMAYDTLLSKVSIPKEQIHYINTDIKPEIAARDYESLLRENFNDGKTTFDLALLGMGDDGHTLSLFPGNESINQTSRWAFSLYLPSQKMHRVTLTADVVNRSACIAFLVTGAAKMPVLNRILNQTAPPHFYPVQLIKPINGEIHWFVDEEAVGRQ